MKNCIAVLITLFLTASLFAQNDKQITRKVEEMIDHICQSPHEEVLLPRFTKVHKVDVGKERLTLKLNIPISFLQNDFDDHVYEELIEHVAAHIADMGFQNLELMARNHAGKYVPLSDFLEESIDYKKQLPHTYSMNNDPVPAREGRLSRKSILYQSVQPRGILDGKTVWLSAGHGWQYDRKRKTFRTQRQNTFGVVEDFATVETVNYYLLKYLYNAGANVWTVRERDMNENEVIVDNDNGYPDYKESGKWTTSVTKGYNGKSYRYTISENTATSKAFYQPNIPESGMYWVSVRYVSGVNRTVDARYKITHAGGESMVSVNQEVHGKTWVYLGQFYFDKGRKAQVTLTNESTERGQAVIADAVRFGGGKGDVADCKYGRKSGEPRFEEASKYYAKYQGFPECLNDVITRPRYAEWELDKGTAQERQDAIYLSIHSNGSGGTGTETYIHNSKAIKGSWTLRHFVHDELIKDIRKGWDGNWRDRGKKSADFGELRGLQTMPGILLEMGFHDNSKDAIALTTPNFRELAARSIYKGIVRYYARKNGTDPIFLPERPTHLSAINQDNGKVTLRWKKPSSDGIYGHAPTEYKVYLSTHGKGFASGIYTRENAYTFKKLKPATTYYFRVTALNKGGESFPTQVIALRTPAIGQNQDRYLIIDGYDRMDRSLAIRKNERMPRYAPLGQLRRLFLERMNNFDYAVEHAKSLEKTNIYFDGATNEVVEAGYLKLNRYDGIDWFLGRESSDDKTLSSRERQVLKSYLDQGGSLIISGSELAYDLVKNKADPHFYKNYLKSNYQGDNAKTIYFQSKGRGVFRGLNTSFNTDAYGYYPVTSPDYITAQSGGTVILNYNNGKGAAVSYDGRYKLFNFAFPLETISDTLVRHELFRRAVQFFGSGEKEPVIAAIPRSVKKNITIDLKRAPEGKAEFRLYSNDGKEVYKRTWKHAGRRGETLAFDEVPPALYKYEIELLGRKQEGVILKE